MSYFKVSIIGSGNVAGHLANALENAGHFVNEVYSRTRSHGEALVSKLYDTSYKEDLDFSESTSDIFIIAVSDSAIKEVAEAIIVPENAILVHTSGTRSLEDLNQYYTENTGVFYPLQTFSKIKKVDFGEIPICVEAKNKAALKGLKTLGKSLSKKVVEIDSQQRMILHIAAVFACNFTNHMFAISEEILRSKNMDFELLKPLIVETINKGLEIGPGAAQTGPAKRKDLETLDKHYDFLTNNDETLAEIYRIISQRILDKYEI